ncbi:hypothetical protein ACFPRL_33075 [Pseudoclavibacter helvolus]
MSAQSARSNCPDRSALRYPSKQASARTWRRAALAPRTAGFHGRASNFGDNSASCDGERRAPAGCH